jgi:hypothetical protein
MNPVIKKWLRKIGLMKKKDKYKIRNMYMYPQIVNPIEVDILLAQISDEVALEKSIDDELWRRYKALVSK